METTHPTGLAPCAEFPDTFFATNPADIALAKATCKDNCTRRADCLEDALADPDPHGVMAGYAPAELKKIRKNPTLIATTRSLLAGAPHKAVA